MKSTVLFFNYNDNTDYKDLEYLKEENKVIVSSTFSLDECINKILKEHSQGVENLNIILTKDQYNKYGEALQEACGSSFKHFDLLEKSSDLEKSLRINEDVKLKEYNDFWLYEEKQPVRKLFEDEQAQTQQQLGAPQEGQETNQTNQDNTAGQNNSTSTEEKQQNIGLQNLDFIFLSGLLGLVAKLDEVLSDNKATSERLTNLNKMWKSDKNIEVSVGSLLNMFKNHVNVKDITSSTMPFLQFILDYDAEQFNNFYKPLSLLDQSKRSLIDTHWQNMQLILKNMFEGQAFIVLNNNPKCGDLKDVDTLKTLVTFKKVLGVDEKEQIKQVLVANKDLTLAQLFNKYQKEKHLKEDASFYEAYFYPILAETSLDNLKKFVQAATQFLVNLLMKIVSTSKVALHALKASEEKSDKTKNKIDFSQVHPPIVDLGNGTKGFKYKILYPTIPLLGASQNFQALTSFNGVLIYLGVSEINWENSLQSGAPIDANTYEAIFPQMYPEVDKSIFELTKYVPITPRDHTDEEIIKGIFDGIYLNISKNDTASITQNFPVIIEVDNSILSKTRFAQFQTKLQAYYDNLGANKKFVATIKTADTNFDSANNVDGTKNAAAIILKILNDLENNSNKDKQCGFDYLEHHASIQKEAIVPVEEIQKESTTIDKKKFSEQIGVFFKNVNTQILASKAFIENKNTQLKEILQKKNAEVQQKLEQYAMSLNGEVDVVACIAVLLGEVENSVVKFLKEQKAKKEAEEAVKKEAEEAVENQNNNNTYNDNDNNNEDVKQIGIDEETKKHLLTIYKENTEKLVKSLPEVSRKIFSKVLTAENWATVCIDNGKQNIANKGGFLATLNQQKQKTKDLIADKINKPEIVKAKASMDLLKVDPTAADILNKTGVFVRACLESRKETTKGKTPQQVKGEDWWKGDKEAAWKLLDMAGFGLIKAVWDYSKNKKAAKPEIDFSKINDTQRILYRIMTHYNIYALCDLLYGGGLQEKFKAQQQIVAKTEPKQLEAPQDSGTKETNTQEPVQESRKLVLNAFYKKYRI